MIEFRLVSMVLLCFVTVSYQNDEVTNTKLDIVFLLDQERTSLKLNGSQLDPEYCEPGKYLYLPTFCVQIFDYFENSSNYQLAYDGVKNWMQSFFDKEGSNEVQFAMIFGCNNTIGGIMHKFKDGNFKQNMPNLLDDGKRGIKTDCGKNFCRMLHLANDFVFTTGLGHRPQSTAIVIVLSDCVHEKLPPSEVRNTKDEFNKFFLKTKGKIYFICYVEFKGNFSDYFKAEIKQFMNETLALLHTNNQTNRSMIYLDGHNVNVGQRLDQLLPKRVGVATVNCNQTWKCGICSGRGTCFAHCNWTTHSWPTGNGTNCTEQAPIIRNCTCSPTTPQPTEPPSYWHILLGFGILLLVLVGLVIGVCCVRAKNNRNKRTKNKAVSVQKAPQKKADIAVDLSREQSKTDTIGQGSKATSVSMKGSMVKSMSKRGSLVKSLAKAGSVSRPVDENAKSISKPKGEESKSKASKSVAGKNVKSIGITKKSVTSKPLLKV